MYIVVSTSMQNSLEKGFETIIRAQLRANTTAAIATALKSRDKRSESREIDSSSNLLFPLIKWIGLHRGNAINCQL